MLRTLMTSKIHRATVTQADLHYVGSVTIDADLLEAAGILENEQVSIVDVTNGSRLETYAITGERGSGKISINGAAAHLVQPGDLVIIMAYGLFEDADARRHEHVAQLRTGRIGDDALDVVLDQTDSRREEGGGRAHEGDEGQRGGRPLQHRRHAADQEHARGHHGRRVD